MFLGDPSGRWESTSIPLSGQDIEYKIASIAPTNISDNIAVLNRILYTAPDNITTSTITEPTLVEFAPAYTPIIMPPTSILVASENRFTGTFSSSPTAPPNPDLITLILI
jgi:hypothetical protein